MFIKGHPYHRPPLNLTEANIRYAMENTKSNAEAARFLHVCVATYRKYATMYVDSESGKNLFELHKNQPGKGMLRTQRTSSHKIIGLDDVLKGNHPEYQARLLKPRLIHSNTFDEMCSQCGFHERRVTDSRVPLRLDWINGDRTDHRRENLQLLCYNCYYLLVG